MKSKKVVTRPIVQVEVALPDAFGGEEKYRITFTRKNGNAKVERQYFFAKNSKITDYLASITYDSERNKIKNVYLHLFLWPLIRITMKAAGKK